MIDANKKQISQKTITVKGSDMKINETCTWLIKSNCKAPYFKINKENSMNDLKIKVNVLEWREASVSTSSTIEDFRQNTDFSMPLQATSWVDTSSDAFVNGRLGDVTMGPDKNVRVSGEWIQYQMN
jgi:hypothetical protein